MHLIRFQGVLTPSAKLRPLVVPQGPSVPEQTNEVAMADERETETVQSWPHSISWVQALETLPEQVFGFEPLPRCGHHTPKIQVVSSP